MRKANNTVSCDSTQNSKLLLYTVNVSDPPPPAFCIFPSFVIKMRVSFYPLVACIVRLIADFIHQWQCTRVRFSNRGRWGWEQALQGCATDPPVGTQKRAGKWNPEEWASAWIVLHTQFIIKSHLFKSISIGSIFSPASLEFFTKKYPGRGVNN